MNTAPSPRHALSPGVFTVALLCVVVTALLWALLAPHAGASVSPSGRRLLVVVVALATATLTFPMRCVLPPHSTRDLLAWPLLVGGSAGLAMLAMGGGPAGGSLAALATLAAGSAVVAVSMEALTRLCRAAGLPAALASGGVLLAFAIAALAPLWLGPLAEVFARHEGVTDAVVAASPLGYLGTLTGYDVLREQWFYANSSLGSLRFTYPGVVPATAMYLGGTAIAALFTRWLESRGARRAPSKATGTGRE